MGSKQGMAWSETDAALFAAVLGRDAAHHLATTPPHLDGPAASAAPAELQARLQDLVERGGVWAYGIFWQESRGAGAGRAVLGWGDGHCRDGGAPLDAAAGEAGAAAERSVARKRALLRLHALYGGGDDDEGADYALRLDRVTDAEMYFLASMYFSFPEGAGGPGHALASGRHAWVAADPRPRGAGAGARVVRPRVPRPVRGAPHRRLPPVQGRRPRARLRRGRPRDSRGPARHPVRPRCRAARGS